VPPAIPRVIFVKGDHWYDDSGQPDPSQERGIAAALTCCREVSTGRHCRAEGLAPYATLSVSQEQALISAVHRGIPAVKTARDDAHGPVRQNSANLFIEGNNLTATKARLQQTAAIISCRFHNAGIAVDASDAAAPCTGLYRAG
jgi:L-asparaginase